MAPTNTMTMDVAKHIMRYVIPDEPGSLKEWKECLPYLAINQLWRDATKPTFYAHGIIKFYESQGDAVSTSNVELMRPYSTSPIVSKLTIEATRVVSRGTIIKTLHNALMGGNNIWHNVQFLYIDPGKHPISSSSNPTVAEIMVILRRLPNISKISLINFAN